MLWKYKDTKIFLNLHHILHENIEFFQQCKEMILLVTKKCIFSSNAEDFDSFWRLCLIFENETNVGPSDNVVQLIEAHSLHTLFAVFEKDQNFQKNQV